MSASRKTIFAYSARRKTWSFVKTVLRSGRPREHGALALVKRPARGTASPEKKMGSRSLVTVGNRN